VDEIETLLKHLKTIGDDAVSRMRQSTDMATMSREHINKNNEMLQSILDAVEHVSAQSQQIAAAAEEQSAVALEISHNMHSVQSLTQQSADTVIETGNFSEEMHQVSQQVMGQLDFFKLSKEKL
jgi:methyl-accepting chemotaxis protein